MLSYHFAALVLLSTLFSLANATKQPNPLLTAVNDEQELTRQALQTLVEHSDLPAEIMAPLSLVNTDMNRLIKDKPKWKYFSSIVRNKECSSDFVYNHRSPPTESKPIMFVYPKEPRFVTDQFKRRIQNDVACLDSLLERKVPVEMVDCRNPKVRNLQQCADYSEEEAHWAVFLESVPITRVISLSNTTFYKRRLLFEAIMQGKQHLIRFLLDQNQDISIGKEHLAVSLYAQNEPLFFYLVHRLQESEMFSREMLKLDFYRVDNRDMAQLAIHKWMYRDYSPSTDLLDWLFSYVPVTANHISAAALKTESITLTNLINRIRSNLNAQDVNELLISSLENSVGTDNLGNLDILLRCISNFQLLDDTNKRLILIHMFKYSETFFDTYNLLSQYFALDIHVENVVDAAFFSRSLEISLFLVNQCRKWTEEEVEYFLGQDFDEVENKEDIEVLKEAVRDKIMDSDMNTIQLQRETSDMSLDD